MATATELQQLYIAYFGRPADPAGLDYWVSSGISTKSFAAVMFAQPEFQSVNSGLSVETQVNRLYINLFGRTADAAGLLYWTNQINTGQIALASVANDLIFSATNSGAASAADLAALTNKTSTAASYTAGIRADIPARLAYQPQSTSPWISGANFASAVSFMTTATATNIPTAAQITASVNSVGAAGTQGATFMLTTGDDPVTGSAANDTISGARIDGVQTLNSGDTINGGAGSDTLTANLNAGVIAPTITNVETIQLTAIGIATVDFVNTTGVTSIVNSASTAALTVDNVVAIAPVTIQNTNQDTTVTFKDAAVAGTADAVTLNLRSVSAGVITLGGETTADAGFETVNIVATGTNVTGNVAFGTTATTLNISGTGSLDIDAAAEFAAVQTINASGLSGALAIALADRTAASDSLDLTITTGAGADEVDLSRIVDADVDNIIVSLGAGNDRLVLDANTDTGNVIDGGAGTDTLSLDIAMDAVTAAYVSNFEVLQFGMAGDLTQDMDLADGMNVVSVLTSGAAANDLNIDDAQNGLVINLDGAALAGVAAGANADITILSVDLKTDTAADTLTVNLNATAGGVVVADFLPNATYETVTVTSSGTAANRIIDISTALNNLTVTGATEFAISGTGALTGVLDAGAFTGAFTATTGTTAITVNGGTGVDTLTSGLLATGVTQTLNGGAGNDVLTAGAIATTGNLVLNGGAGMDTINTTAMTGTAAATTSTAVINGGGGFDFIAMGDTPGAAGTVLQDIVSTVVLTADLDVVAGFGTLVDDLDYNGALLNGANSTVVNAGSTSLALAVAANVDATAYFVTDNLTGTATTTLTALANATITSEVATLAAAFETALVSAIGSSAIAGLDNAVGAGESVLITFDNGTDSVVVRFTNSDTSVANTITVGEIEVVAVFDAALLVATDII